MVQSKEEKKKDNSKMEICLDVNSDMISNLPANITDQILVRLPIGDAVRTSVLSTKWRYKWTTIPDLVFHEKSALPYFRNKNKLINFIDRVLLLHTGFIHKFELSNMSKQNCPILDSWIVFLSRKNIKEFVLKINFNWQSQEVPYYKLSTSIFSAQQISTLELHWCALKKPPPTFTGFSNLKSLYLYETTFVDDKDGFEFLISKCPLLERLTWSTIFDSFGHLNICSPNLKYLCLRGSFEDICFENTPLLSDVSIYSSCNITNEMLEEFLRTETRNVVKVLSSLPSLRKLEGQRYFLEFLSLSKIPEKLPFTCHHLNNLTLELNFQAVNAVCVTLCLLNSSPNLRDLAIHFYPFDKPAHDVENFWEERTLIDWNMSGLQNVKITNNQGFKSELEFIKLLLAKSPMLEMLSFKFGSSDIQDRIGLKFLKQLLIFPRASPEAKIKFLEHEK